MKKLKLLFLTSIVGLVLFMACKKSHPNLLLCGCPNMGFLMNQWQWTSTQNGNGQISYPQPGSSVIFTSNKQHAGYSVVINGQAADSGNYSTPGFDTLQLTPFTKPEGGLYLPDSIYLLQFVTDSMYLISLPNSTSGNTKISFALHDN